jgi:hypothetical protein
MEFKGRLILVLPMQTGEGRNGTWKKQEFVIETGEQYPKKICLEVWGDKINENQLQIGNQLVVQGDVESREHMGKWYTGVKAWKIEVAAQQAGSGAIAVTEPAPDFFTESETDNLPF